MITTISEFRMELGGRPLVLEFGGLAKQANGSVLVRYGDTAVLVTATMSKEPREGIDFFPLLVDYEERLYSVGKIPGGWGRREGRPSEDAILSARMIDRPLRPLFPDGFRNDVHVVATILSVDKNNSPTIAAMIGASAALHVSDIPFDGPIGGVNVGYVNGEFVINPTLEQQAVSELDLTVAGTEEAVMMVEAAANEVSEDVALEAITYGHRFIQELCRLQEQIREEIGKEKVEVPVFQVEESLLAWVREKTAESLPKAVQTFEKLERESLIAAVEEQAHSAYIAEFGEEAYEEKQKDIGKAFDILLKEEVRRSITKDKLRPDGRKPDEIRPISCGVGILPRVHGSGLFTRGQTQALTALTLGLKSDAQLLDDLTNDESKRYIHHYNFPPYSVGEVRPIRGPGRREIGHGALAERALLPVIPDKEEFPYTLRLVSEILESNGSSSMASVCGSTLALMDGGVPIKRPVAGIAMGLMMMDSDYTILTDIQGMEDALGDMDFKVAGTEVGITALQMDIKIGGVSRAIMAEALEQAKQGRLFILNKMSEALAAPRPELSLYAPRIITLQIPVDRIRDVIGPGGKVIRKIIEETGASIDIEDDGTVYIASSEGGGGEKARQLVEYYTKDAEVGEKYLGTVKRVMEYGAFVEILPGKEGLVHISQLAHHRVKKVEDIVSEGDEILVKVTGIDKQGRINLSRKEALPPEQES
ncbi:MAG: polyribonucleotide nucleotidyltransferase [Bacillota bacterium]|jgi:polyribonucleotide nucleotidyltransferase|nr:polyribonucleotide nucleotidyltransferase [Bacillota bacterium]